MVPSFYNLLPAFRCCVLTWFKHSRVTALRFKLAGSFFIATTLSGYGQVRIDRSSPGYYEDNIQRGVELQVGHAATSRPSKQPRLALEEYRNTLQAMPGAEQQVEALGKWGVGELRGSELDLVQLIHEVFRSPAEPLTAGQKGMLCYLLGNAFERVPLGDSAQYYYGQVGRHVLETDKLNIESMRRRAHLSYLDAEYDKSLLLLDSASFLLKGSGNVFASILVLNQKALVQQAKGNLSESIRILTECVERLNEAEGLKPEQKGVNELNFLNQLSNLYIATKDFEQAQAFAYKGIAKSEKLGWSHTYFNFVNNLVRIQLEMNQPDSALQLLVKSMESKDVLLESQKNSTYVSFVLVYLAKEQPDSALKYLKKLEVEFPLRYGSPQHKGFMKLYARYYKLVGEHQNAIRAANYSRSAMPSGPFPMVEDLYLVLHESHFALGHYDSAYYYLERYSTMSAEHFNLQRLQQVEYMKREYERKESEWVIEDLGRRNRLNLVYFTIAIAFAVFVITVLVLGLSNARRRNELVIKENELADQKVLTLLKEQEVLAAESILEGREEQRKILSQQLHDEIGSQLATVKLHLESLLENAEQWKGNAAIQASVDLVDLTYNRVRSLSHDLNSHLMLSKGLQRSLEQHVSRLNVSDRVDVTLDLSEFNGIEDEKLNVLVFNIIMELLANALKYANASDIHVQMIQYPQELNLIVEDNGVGFDPAKVDFKGLGIMHLESRVKQFGGRFSIDSVLNRGTIVIVDLPL